MEILAAGAESISTSDANGDASPSDASDATNGANLRLGRQRCGRAARPVTRKA
jgi:hypothetical protein